MNVPALRFKEFSGDWEEKKIGDIATVSSGGTPSRTNLEFWNGNIPWVTTSEVRFNRITDTAQKITEHALNNSSAKMFPKNTLLIAMYGEGKTRGQVAKLEIEASTNQACAAIILKNHNSDFFFQYLQNNYENIRNLSNDGGQKNLSGLLIKSISVVYPSLQEQTKIANFLTAVDDKITLLTKKADLLSQYKKGVMQQIFSQELRFKDDDGQEFPEWEEKRLDEIFKITRGNVLAMTLVSEVQCEDNPYPVYSSQTKNNGLSGYFNSYLYQDSITWTTDGANAGDVNYRQGKFYCTNVCGVLINDKGHANACVAELINAVSKRYVSYVGNPKLMNNVMAKIEIQFPSLKEQTKIANFLTAIDEKITNNQTQLDAVKQYKQGLLQQMFV